jgi:uncharacterized membrane protein
VFSNDAAPTAFLGSSVVEQVTVNHLVGGSNPPRGANERAIQTTWMARFFYIAGGALNADLQKPFAFRLLSCLTPNDSAFRRSAMTKNRLEAFSDGVIAIIITIMVLELKVPHTVELSGLRDLIPVFLSYVLSFIYVAIYWNNHHHLLHAAHHVNGPVLWANMHLLFWLSLVPFVTGWMGENHFAATPVACYGVVLLMAAVAYTLLVKTLVKLHGKDSVLSKAIGNDGKGKLSLLLYVLGISTAIWFPLIAGLLYVSVAIIWLIPDRRIEKHLTH